MDRFYIKQGDRREPVDRILLGSDGNPVNLTGASVKFLMRDEAGTVVVNAAAAIVGTATDGRVRYSWAANDTATAGHFLAEFEVTFSDTTKQSFPNDGYLEVYVTDDIG